MLQRTIRSMEMAFQRCLRTSGVRPSFKNKPAGVPLLLPPGLRLHFQKISFPLMFAAVANNEAAVVGEEKRHFQFTVFTCGTRSNHRRFCEQVLNLSPGNFFHHKIQSSNRDPLAWLIHNADEPFVQFRPSAKKPQLQSAEGRQSTTTPATLRIAPSSVAGTFETRLGLLASV